MVNIEAVKNKKKKGAHICTTYSTFFWGSAGLPEKRCKKKRGKGKKSGKTEMSSSKMFRKVKKLGKLV